MEFLKYVLENGQVRNLLDSNENVMGYMVQKFPIISKDIIVHVNKNKKDFICPNNYKKTKKNISYYSEQVCLRYLYDCSIITNYDISDKNKLELVDELASGLVSNFKSDIKETAKKIGRNFWDSFKHPIIGMVGISNLIAYFTSDWYRENIVQAAPALFKKLLGWEVKEVSSLGMTSFALMISLALILTMLKMLNSKDMVKVYFFNKTTKQFLSALKAAGFRDELKAVDVKTSKIYQVKKYQDCLSKTGISDDSDEDLKKEKVSDCYFNLLITNDMSSIMKAYLKFLQNNDISTKNIKSFSQLMDSPLPNEHRGIQELAKQFNLSFRSVLKVFYNNNTKQQVHWIDKLNKELRKLK
jgi:hypothetical protein